MKKLILFSAFMLTLFASCSSTGKVTNEPIGKRLKFGNGGGFTGIYTSYELHDDGLLFALKSDNSKQQLKKLRKKQTREIFELAEKLKVSQPGFDHPGNMTSFINYEANGVTTEYKWGETNITVPAGIQDLYTKLNTIVK